MRPLVDRLRARIDTLTDERDQARARADRIQTRLDNARKRVKRRDLLAAEIRTLRRQVRQLGADLRSERLGREWAEARTLAHAITVDGLRKRLRRRTTTNGSAPGVELRLHTSEPPEGEAG